MSAPKIYEINEIPKWSTDSENYVRSAPAKAQVNANINNTISLFNTSITQVRVDAIQNAANSHLGGGTGINGVIHAAAGYANLRSELAYLGGCPTGQTKLTKGYNITSVKYIMHSVGPDCTISGVSAETRAEQLKSSYITALELAKERGLQTIALCGMSLGVYECPKDEYIRMACEAVRMWLEHEDNWGRVSRIIFVVFDPNFAKNTELMTLYRQHLSAYFPKPR